MSGKPKTLAETVREKYGLPEMLGEGIVGHEPEQNEVAAPLLGILKKLGMSGNLAMTPNDLNNMIPAWNSPWPSTNQELLKAFTDGATGAKEYVKETADRFKEMHGESLKDIPSVPISIFRNVRLWPLLLRGSTRLEAEKEEVEE